MQLVVNDYWQLALEVGCDFVHLGQGDLDAADVPALRRADVRLGVSTHDEAELERALSRAPGLRRARAHLSDTMLKVMPWQPQGLARVGEWKRRIGVLPLVASAASRSSGCPSARAGADVAAVVTDIVRAADPEARRRAAGSARAAA